MEHIFITGISGLLGTNLVHLLLENGFKITGLVRKRSSYKGKQHENLSIVEGELFDNHLPLLKEVDRVVHIAAITEQHHLHYKPYQRINCEASVQLFHSAQMAKVKQFVFVSTANTIGNGTKDNPGHEEKQVKPPFSNSFYAQSKMEAENRLLDGMKEMDLCIFNPSFMIGAYDSKPSSGKIITMILNKRFLFVPPGGKNFVHVEDVAHGILKAFNKGKRGEKYVMGNENLSYQEFYQLVLKKTKQKSSLISLPKFFLLGVSYVGDLLRSCGMKTALSSNNMRILCEENYYSNQKSRDELGIQFQPIEKAVNDAVEYFKLVR